ncbi:flagellar biosynthetic protein FliO [Neobacillus niacini]|uniref:flagellar biosynthetic protein FliO n=1 Tax=Neobacillus niacini TaxID=86668 RepID=UPI0030026EBD
MKHFMLLFVMFFNLLSFQTTIHAEETKSSAEPSVYDSIHQDEVVETTPKSAKVVDSPSSSIFPLFFKFIFSFLLVIGLMFALLRFLSKRNTSQSNGSIIPLGGHVLGNNRSLQILLIGKTIYIVGVGDTITLVRTLSEGEEYQHLLKSYENQADTLSPTEFLKDSTQKWSSVLQKQLKKMQRENDGV